LRKKGGGGGLCRPLARGRRKGRGLFNPHVRGKRENKTVREGRVNFRGGKDVLLYRKGVVVFFLKG